MRTPLTIEGIDDSTAVELRAAQERFLKTLRTGQDIIREPGPCLFREPAGDTISARWNIYREGYVLRLAESIGNDHPAVERIVGSVAFIELCRRYLTAFPPSSHDIGRAGASLAAYLPGDPATQSLPFLPDLARFEWALAEALVAPDAAPVTWNEISAIGADAFADLPLRGLPGTAVIRSEWPLGDLRLAKDKVDEEIDIDLESGPTSVIIWRRGLEPRWKEGEEDEVATIEGISAGMTPTSLLVSGAFGNDQNAPQRLIAALRRLVELEILAPLQKEENA